MSSVPSRRSEQLSLGQLMLLVSGAAVGMAVFQASRVGLLLPFELGYSELVFGCYLSLAGVAMVAAVMMVVEKLRWGRPWSPPATALFVVGLLAWCLAPLASCSFVILAPFAPPGRWFDEAYLNYQPGTLALVGFSEVWPVVSVSLLAACGASGQAPQWWQLRGAWPEWLGMWMLAAWSLPAIHAIYRAATFVPLPPELQ